MQIAIIVFMNNIHVRKVRKGEGEPGNGAKISILISVYNLKEQHKNCVEK